MLLSIHIFVIPIHCLVVAHIGSVCVILLIIDANLLVTSNW